MRDYSNMPTLKWDGEAACYKAKAQILREEPVILVLPESAVLELDPEAVGCEVDADSGILFNCEPRAAMERIAGDNGIEALKVIGEAAHESGSQLDVDPKGHRLIVHD